MASQATQQDFRLMVCPYLPLGETVTFGDYIVGPASSLEDQWQDDEFRRLGSDVLNSYTNLKREPLSDPALVGHVSHGLNLPDPRPCFQLFKPRFTSRYLIRTRITTQRLRAGALHHRITARSTYGGWIERASWEPSSASSSAKLTSAGKPVMRSSR